MEKKYTIDNYPITIREQDSFADNFAGSVINIYASIYDSVGLIGFIIILLLLAAIPGVNVIYTIIFQIFLYCVIYAAVISASKQRKKLHIN